jgi:hypothetical protein
MKSILTKALGTSVVLLLAVAGPAMAYSGHACHLGAPEIDPSLMGSGLALLVSGVAVVIERYRKR